MAEILRRPALDTENLFDTVRSIIDRVKAEGTRRCSTTKPGSTKWSLLR
jgi:hypothetical protein